MTTKQLGTVHPGWDTLDQIVILLCVLLWIYKSMRWINLSQVGFKNNHYAMLVLLRASCLTLENRGIQMLWGANRGKWKDWQSNSEHLWLEPPVLCHWATTAGQPWTLAFWHSGSLLVLFRKPRDGCGLQALCLPEAGRPCTALFWLTSGCIYIDVCCVFLMSWFRPARSLAAIVYSI